MVEGGDLSEHFDDSRLEEQKYLFWASLVYFQFQALLCIKQVNFC
jgi:hypothetical protein